MKATSPLRLAGILAITISIAAGESKFSGIYKGTVSSGPRFVAAVTDSGRVLGLDERSENFADLISPSKSSVNKEGKFKGSTANGASITATVSKDLKLTGTIKRDGVTYRISGRRVFK